MIRKGLLAFAIFLIATVGVLLTLALVDRRPFVETRIRVLDDLTGQPVPNATVTPFAVDRFSKVSQVEQAVTDNNGCVTLRHRGEFQYAELTHPRLRHVTPRDRPAISDGVHLFYLRRPPRVAVVVPDDFVGPFVVSVADLGDDAREPEYRLTLPADSLEPVAIPGITGDLVRDEEIEAERRGLTVTPAPKDNPRPDAIHVWVIQPSMFYEADYVQLFFVGTQAEFHTFDRELQSRLSTQGPAKRLDRRSLGGLRDTVLKRFDRSN